MSLPVSQYEALLAEVRGLRRKAEHVQELVNPLLSDQTSNLPTKLYNNVQPLNYTMDSLLVDQNYDLCGPTTSSSITAPDDEFPPHRGSTTQMSVSSEPVPNQHNKQITSLYHGTWPVEKTMWNSEPINLSQQQQQQQDVTSVMSFASSSGGVPLDRVLGSPNRSSQQLEAKVDMVYSLLAMLGGQEHADMGETLLALSASPESCLAMRQSGCIPLLVQLVQSDKDNETKKKASQALHNLVHAQPDDKLRKRETRILKLLETVQEYTETLKLTKEQQQSDDKHPVQTVAHVMKLSFDEGHRQAICHLGGIYTIAHLVVIEHQTHDDNKSIGTQCVLMRRYACMALTNLTFGDSGNKALLCSLRDFMRALVVQLQSASDELRQVTASVLRNLSWRADVTSKEILRDVGSVTGLMKAAMLVDNKENTLKSILSALWNLSAHCTENKSEICGVEGALGFLVDMLAYKTPTKSLAIIENSGGILRNISSQIAVRDDYREILRQHNCLQILLEQLKSPSLTIVSNACGTLWNLSAKCSVDQEILWQLGAPSMLRSLNHSKHKMIAMGSSAALKNLLSARPQNNLVQQIDSTALQLDLPVLPTLGARKQKALLQELDNNLTETYENIDKDSPIKKKLLFNDANSLNSSFASLNINEQPSTSGGFANNFGNSSLPYSFVRNKFSDCTYEDEMMNEQPIDYSQKYSETKLPTAKSNNKQQTTTTTTSSKNQSFSMYAETDLDQPTDYSLRYAEDDSDSEICTKNPEYIQDTIKTYCTEDTPYETPFNFSTATSMSDLRVDNNNKQQQQQQQEQIIDNDKMSVAHVMQKTKEETNNKSSFDEKDHCSTEDISVEQVVVVGVVVTQKKSKSEFSSGLMSPEKPVNYCEEGTPGGYFSRVSSFGSMNSLPANDTMKHDGETMKDDDDDDDDDEEKMKENDKKSMEQKAVKFEQHVNYAEETPLMFSRSSSLASLDSIEQHSIHDDHSSVVSDLRLTSGIVSPSELPDSPTQTVPQSPKFPATSKEQQQQQRRKQCKSVFEDNLTKFKEESTPVQFSTATSLSSLTIDDEANNENSTPEKENEKRDSEKEAAAAAAAAASQECEDERILAACINIGMQNTRHTQNKPNTSKLPLPKPLLRRQMVRPPADTVKTYCTEDTPAILSHAGSNSDISILSISNDSKSKRDYLSDASSNLSADDENLLAECIQSGMPKSNKETTKTTTTTTACDYLSDASSSNLSADDDNILAECIKSGMPKAKQNYNNEKTTTTTCQLNRKLKCTTTTGGGEADKMQTNKLYNNTVKDECRNYVEINPQQFSLRSSLSDLTTTATTVDERLKKCDKAGACNKIHEDSLSSASGDGSLNSSETEQAILDQCILAGMPKTGGNQLIHNNKVQQKQCEDDSKNVNVASVVTKQTLEMCPVVVGAMADVVEEVKQQQQQQQGTIETCLVDFEENLLIEQTKNGSKNLEFTNNYHMDVCLLSKSCENSNQIVDNRMLDPDAMIESLDRFTAELVSQASHLTTKDEMNFKHSSNGDCTWNEESGITFPSISGSTPNVITFKSDENSMHEDILDGLNEEEPFPSNDFSSSTTMTESTLIAIEANKMVTVFKNEAEMSQSTNSLQLDEIQPPSLIHSLANSPKLIKRKKSLPASLLAKRAINNYMTHGSSIDSLSNLDHINPPSELFDSVSSLSSLQQNDNGVLNIDKNDVPINPIFNIKQTNGMNYLNSCTSTSIDLENVNPPSIFNEITDLCNSLADINTETICSETEIFEDCCTHVQTEFSDATSITPIPSDFGGSSSNESTPSKKMKKQHRTRTDRYKTYTINASESSLTTLSDYQTVNDEFYSIVDESTTTNSTKLTPKQRRQMDSERFKTRIIDAKQIENCQQSPTKTKLNIRKSFIQKRIENKERFRTQTLPESSFSSLPETDLNLIVQNEANVVVKNLNETQTPFVHDLLDCETLSLVSNDEDDENSEQNSNNSSINYRTYHKSWGIIKQTNLPIVQTCEENDEKPIIKPKIVKPNENEEISTEEAEQQQQQPKPVRGRRKPLYSKTNLTHPKPSTSLINKTVNKTVSNIKPPSGSQNKGKTIPNKTPSSPLNKPNTKIAKPSLLQKPKPVTPSLERQGTFTKPEPVQKTSSKIPTFASKLAKAVNGAGKSVKSTSGDRSTPRRIVYNRSTSADSRETATSSRKIQNSASSQSLTSGSSSGGGGGSSGVKSGAVKKSGIPNPRSQTTTTTTTTNASTKKQVTSKIANLWKKIEESKKQQVKNDTRVWIQPETPTLIRSNTFDNKDGVVMRKKTTTTTPENEVKRVSRLGSFIIMDENGENV